MLYVKLIFDGTPAARTFALVKTVVAIVVFISLTAQCLVQLGIVGYYELNKQYIATHLCVNRDKPQMKCCGRCYLRKQLRKIDDTSNSKNLPNKVEKTEPFVCIIPQRVIFTTSHQTNISIKNPGSQHLHGSELPFPVFHPPAYSC